MTISLTLHWLDLIYLRTRKFNNFSSFDYGATIDF